MFCTKCGAGFSKEAKFCPDCGQAVSNAEAVASASVAKLEGKRHVSLAFKIIVLIALIFTPAFYLIGATTARERNDFLVWIITVFGLLVLLCLMIIVGQLVFFGLKKLWVRLFYQKKFKNKIFDRILKMGKGHKK